MPRYLGIDVGTTKTTAVLVEPPSPEPLAVHTVPTGGGTQETTTNQHFFSELGQRIINTTSRPGASGRLYEVDARLRPTGRSGALATSLG